MEWNNVNINILIDHSSFNSKFVEEKSLYNPLLHTAFKKIFINPPIYSFNCIVLPFLLKPGKITVRNEKLNSLNLRIQLIVKIFLLKSGTQSGKSFGKC